MGVFNVNINGVTVRWQHANGRRDEEIVRINMIDVRIGLTVFQINTSVDLVGKRH
ncbi:hypothetical protein D032_0230 [Vibrio parahaemolyticus V14/01]|nr:hypothetical protein D032_0230 [Vibrio parahaemolyticus V14/01]